MLIDQADCLFARQLSLEEFIRKDDALQFGEPNHKAPPRVISGLRNLAKRADMHVINAFETVSALQSHLEECDLLDADRLRPRWDTYFMVAFIIYGHATAY